jgi:type IV secretory pathway VirJ component
MPFPTGTISTANVDSPSDDPSLARADIYDSFVALNAIISSANAALGVLILDGSGKITASRLPATYSTTAGNIQLSPASGITNINRVLRLAQTFTTDLGTVTGTTAPSAGDLVYLVDGDAGQPCVGCYDGTAWRVIRLQTTVGDVGAEITASASLTATADV